MKKRNWLIAAFAVCAVFGSGAILAAEESSGVDYFMTVESESFEVGDNAVVRTKSTGFVIGEPPFDMVNQTCFGTQVTAADGAVSLRGYCDAHDGDGDMYWNTYVGDASGGTWEMTGGTGKFAGMTGGGAWKAGPAFADGKWTVVWDGSLEKK